jgi:preprotein translocase subunit SecE
MREPQEILRATWEVAAVVLGFLIIIGLAGWGLFVWLIS